LKPDAVDGVLWTVFNEGERVRPSSLTERVPCGPPLQTGIIKSVTRFPRHARDQTLFLAGAKGELASFTCGYFVLRFDPARLAVSPSAARAMNSV
jgi:hypothetical protein